MKERALLLCIAYPEISTKYEIKYCMAGVTEEGEFRRIYPVPLRIYKRKDFHKRRWLEYEVISKGDRRKESMKINPKGIQIGDEMAYDDVRDILESKATTLEELQDAQKKDNTSIGIVKPLVDDFSLREDPDRIKQKLRVEAQRTLFGRRLPIRIIPHWSGYSFRCSEDCSGHKILCEDIEVGMLYWNCLKRYREIDEVESKMREKLVSWMREKRDLYFMLGTHFRWGTWLIISILYPPKKSKRRILTLEDFL